MFQCASALTFPTRRPDASIMLVKPPFVLDREIVLLRIRAASRIYMLGVEGV